MSVTPDSCWPVDIACDLRRRPKAVLIAEIRARGDNDRATPPNLTYQGVDWDYVPIRGKPHIRIRNIPGLEAGTYDIRLLVIET